MNISNDWKQNSHSILSPIEYHWQGRAKIIRPSSFALSPSSWNPSLSWNPGKGERMNVLFWNDGFGSRGWPCQGAENTAVFDLGERESEGFFFLFFSLWDLCLVRTVTDYFWLCIYAFELTPVSSFPQSIAVDKFFPHHYGCVRMLHGPLITCLTYTRNQLHLGASKFTLSQSGLKLVLLSVLRTRKGLLGSIWTWALKRSFIFLV